MNKKIKCLTILMVIGIVLVFIIALYFFPALYIGGAFSPNMTPNIAQRDYNKYEKEFNILAEYISDNEIKDFRMNKEEFRDFSTPDMEVYNAINTLIKAKYRQIGIEENTLYFQKYATLDCGKGIMYSLDGELPYLQFLTDVQKLSAKNWYYYEDDYNKWRLENEKKNNY